MLVTRSVLVLWIASASFACAASYAVAYLRSALALTKLEHLDLGGGQAFGMAFPSLLAFAIAAACAIVAIAALAYSWQTNKQPIMSSQHKATLWFLAPLAVVMVSGYGT